MKAAALACVCEKPLSYFKEYLSTNHYLVFPIINTHY
jgi:hypothetical protein